MKNFEKSDIISDVAFNKNKAKFLPRNEQMMINNQLKTKLLRFVDEIQADKNRPESMKLFDNMMNDMHGQRVKDLYAYRRAGNHVVSLLCSSTPPELIYAMDNHIPVSVCMGAGEVEKYADEYTKGMCSLSRSMIGFLKTGMCVFFNLSDQVLGSDFCPCIKKASGIIQEISDDFEVYCTESHLSDDNRISINYNGLDAWINKRTQGKGLNRERFKAYCNLYSEIRMVYKSIMDLRKSKNPPIDGKNTLWTQQLYPVEEPRKLLAGLLNLKDELVKNSNSNIGYNDTGEKKRVMLITPRIMPPFTEIYRLIENNNAIIVCEITDIGITNINYDIDDFNRIIDDEHTTIEQSVRFVMEGIDKNVSSCFIDFDVEEIIKQIEVFGVDAVISFSFINCPNMEIKTKQISATLNKKGIKSIALQSDYLDIYDKEEIFLNEIGRFLEF